MALRPRSTRFANGSSRLDNLTRPSSIAPWNSLATLSSEERYNNSASLRKTSKTHDRRSSTLALASDTRNKSKYWPSVPSQPPDKLWTHQPTDSNKLGPTASFTPFYFAKPFGTLTTTKQWSTSENTSIANYKREDDHRHQTRPARVLHPPTSPTFWNASTIHPCVMCTANRSSRTEETMTSTTSEVAVFTP